VTPDSRLEAHADRIIHMEDGKILNDHMVAQPAGMHATSKTEQ
jgi:putative ABC transport system ATP-binding protein